ncbi:MarR family winged helix-turn-helix transcriptional regulator [Micromonospora olivasterospora]|uniref:MarR family transcriptional regulator n=1 Tax=Micromonospora olivasterospora TaxID=1880 RepID=A0A562IIC1_MICOL|nr:MarR family transcriptional regulator [Micromonospora olivasterospora]TWH70578.1 MarR family transcriptional regulator [Micromonospora olivasterospora]
MSKAESAQPDGSPPPQDLRLLYAIGRLDRGITRELQHGLKPLGLSPHQYVTLTVLRARSGLSNAQLARRAYVSPQAMIQVLASLQADGLITRSPSGENQRILETRLTDKGREIAERCDRIADEIENRMLAGVPQKDRKALLAAVRACVQRINAGLPGG